MPRKNWPQLNWNAPLDITTITTHGMHFETHYHKTRRHYLQHPDQTRHTLDNLMKLNQQYRDLTRHFTNTLKNANRHDQTLNRKLEPQLVDHLTETIAWANYNLDRLEWDDNHNLPDNTISAMRYINITRNIANAIHNTIKNANEHHQQATTNVDNPKNIWRKMLWYYFIDNTIDFKNRYPNIQQDADQDQDNFNEAATETQNEIDEEINNMLEDIE